MPVAIVEGKLVEWEPLAGFDGSIGTRQRFLGATAYAYAILAGKPEEVAHQEAERAAFESLYGVQYGPSTIPQDQPSTNQPLKQGVLASMEAQKILGI